jgi:hypothetical protein
VQHAPRLDREETWPIFGRIRKSATKSWPTWVCTLVLCRNVSAAVYGKKCAVAMLFLCWGSFRWLCSYFVGLLWVRWYYLCIYLSFNGGNRNFLVLSPTIKVLVRYDFALGLGS